MNGPDDFSYTVDRLYSAGSANERQRYGTEWLAYVDDLTVRTGRVLDGRVLTDEEYRKEVQAAAKSANAASGLQHPAEALGELGFNPEGLGAECDARKSRRKEGSKHDQANTDKEISWQWGSLSQLGFGHPLVGVMTCLVASSTMTSFGRSHDLSSCQQHHDFICQSPGLPAHHSCNKRAHWVLVILQSKSFFAMLFL